MHGDSPIDGDLDCAHPVMPYLGGALGRVLVLPALAVLASSLLAWDPISA